ncbi:hypothetical protein HMPREF1565_0286 [Providencia alcalifaciens RIMD 1656011]|uniref:Uncharacterized protein n=1 Tax=Providencia alcalifaciens DSM 30120 TaxID=520999 RepID=B6XEH8_9GAMM|nr:hypothetical protein PROVALCAL_01758 [Providencia alcalifaciens DSM 30120]EUD03283.1 hypothetical protein HMPREF1565_0286 [Providencia alcalifaciens RIMD 1656011]
MSVPSSLNISARFVFVVLDTTTAYARKDTNILPPNPVVGMGISLLINKLYGNK